MDKSIEADHMNIIAAVLGALLFVYLVVALLNPERFE